MQDEPDIFRKTIKSFVLRQGKMTKAQRRALETLMPKYVIPFEEQQLQLATNTDTIIEIGFGNGEASWMIAKEHQNYEYIGIEVHKPGVANLLMQLDKNNINNLKIINHDAVEVLKFMIPDNSIAGFHIYFPDPWHKTRHHKRRLIKLDFITVLVAKLKIGAYIHIATDWQDYAIEVLNLLNSINQLKNCSQDNNFIEKPDFRPITKFELRGVNLKHQIYDLMYMKTI